MKIEQMKFLLVALMPFIFSSCAKYYHNPAPQVLPQHVRKIAVRPFANQTQQYGLEDKLTLTTQNEFNRDGRYAITNEEQADGVVIGVIDRYIHEALTYDANQIPTQYKLWILVNVKFYDKIQRLTLWEEPHLSGEQRYYVAPYGPAGQSLTEEEARQNIWDQLARDIRTRTFEGFGSVTGFPDRAAPKTSPDQFDSLRNKNDNAPPVPSEEPNSPALRSPY